MPIVVSTHPRTMTTKEKTFKNAEKNNLHEPFGLNDYINLQLNSFCVF